MPKVSESYLEARRQHLLDAAMVCFAEKGFHATTMHDIAREAGVSYGIVYHYFRSKDDIMVAATARSHAERAQRFAAAEEHAATCQVLDEILRLSLERWAQPESLVAARMRMEVAAEGMRNPSIAAMVYEGLEDWRTRLAAIIRRGQQQGEINPDLDPVAAAHVLLGLGQGFVVLKVMDPAIDVTQYLAGVRALLGCTFWHPPDREGRDDNQGAAVCSETE